MNILVVTKAAWDDRIASGNTLSNFFENWKNVKFYCIYARGAMPQNRVCKEYYSISPISIIRNVFIPKKLEGDLVSLHHEEDRTLQMKSG